MIQLTRKIANISNESERSISFDPKSKVMQVDGLQ